MFVDMNKRFWDLQVSFFTDLKIASKKGVMRVFSGF